MDFKSIIYAVACLSFSVVVGAAIYEHVAVVPGWSAAPPASLSMFQGKYGLNPTPFWIAIHPVTLVLLAAAIILFRKTASRPYLLITTAGYVIVLIITFAHFVPELIAITGTPYSENIDDSLTRRASQWEALSLVRMTSLIILAVIGISGLSRSNEPV